MPKLIISLIRNEYFLDEIGGESSFLFHRLLPARWKIQNWEAKRASADGANGSSPNSFWEIEWQKFIRVSHPYLRPISAPQPAQRQRNFLSARRRIASPFSIAVRTPQTCFFGLAVIGKCQGVAGEGGFNLLLRTPETPQTGFKIFSFSTLIFSNTLAELEEKRNYCEDDG